MYLLNLSVIFSCICLIKGDNFLAKFYQDDWKLEYLRAEIVSVDKAILKSMKIITFKFNRTIAVSNISFEYVKNLGNDCDIVIQTYKFASNEYRIFPARFRVNLCAFIIQNIFGVGVMFHAGDVPLCPIKKNILYRCDNFYPDESRFPPFIPTGEYKVELTYLHKDKVFAIQNYYGNVYRPIKIED